MRKEQHKYNTVEVATMKEKGRRNLENSIARSEDREEVSISFATSDHSREWRVRPFLLKKKIFSSNTNDVGATEF